MAFGGYDPEYEELLLAMAQGGFGGHGGHGGGAQPQPQGFGAPMAPPQMPFPTPQGRQVGPLFVASSPFEAIASGLGAWKQQKNANALKQAMAQKRQQFLQGITDPAQRQAAEAMFSGDPAMATYGGHILKKAMDAQAKKIGERPAPAAWNALPEMTAEEAIQSGYAKKDEGFVPLEPELVARANQLKIPTTGRKREPIIADILAAEKAATDRGTKSKEEESKAAGEKFDRELKLNAAFRSTQVFKDADAVKSAYARLEATPPGGAGDLGLITMYMKLVDPTTGVKEQEFRTAAESMGVWEKLQGYKKQVEGTGRLTDKSRAEFKSAAKALRDAAKRAYEKEAKREKSRAKKYGLDPENVVLQFDDDEEGTTVAPRSGRVKVDAQGNIIP